MANDERQWYRRIFRTAHRILLERHLRDPIAGLAGDVLVLGAGYENYRDSLACAQTVFLTDIDTENDRIDQVMDAHKITFGEDSFDAVVAIEIFENLRNPTLAASEVFRVLRPGGRALISIPFLFRVHGDPHDFQRFTASGLETLFQKFSSVSVEGFGRRNHVISDIVTTASRALVPLRIFNHALTFRPLHSAPSKDCPSGFIVQLRK